MHAHPRVKICCIASLDEARLAVRAGASAIGLVAHMPSGPGPISDTRIREIAMSTAPPVSRFLLTSRTEPNAVVDHVRQCAVDTVQLVDAVPETTYTALRHELPAVRIVQVIHVEGDDALDQARTVAVHVDAILLDSGRPSAAVPELGGTGRAHDWSISRAIVDAVPRPVFLAGGLGTHNIAEAVATVRPFGVDLCSSVRTEGHLDSAKLDAFFQALH